MSDFLKNTIKSIGKVFAKIFSSFLKPCIVFESYPDFSDNTKYVYDEIVKRGYQKKYYLIWQTDEDKIAIIEDNLFWKAKRPNTPKKFILSFCFYFNRKCTVICNRFFQKKEPDVPMIYLTHGTPLKSVRDYYTIPDFVDYAVTTSPLSTQILSYESKFDEKKCFELGYPRNDILTNNNFDIHGFFDNKYSKIIVWYPTYRKHKSGYIRISESTLPILCDEESAKLLNENLKELNTLIVVKPHYAQDLSYLNICKLNNLKFIDDNFYTENGITSYQFVGACDALLTDYSSVYYDFTLCNKPIGLIWEDIEDYSKMPGLIQEYEQLTSGGYKIYNLDDLLIFINDISSGNDRLKVERNAICSKINSFSDGKSTERVADFVIKIANN